MRKCRGAGVRILVLGHCGVYPATGTESSWGVFAGMARPHAALAQGGQGAVTVAIQIEPSQQIADGATLLARRRGGGVTQVERWGVTRRRRAGLVS